MKRGTSLLVVLVGLLLTACGGGGSSAGAPAQPSQPSTTVTLGVFPTTLAGTKDADISSDFIITNTDKVSGYAWPFQWTLTGLPSGMTYSQTSNGSHMSIGGRPSVSGSFTVHVVIRDATQAVKVDTNITLTLDTAFKLAGLPPGYVPLAVVGLPYSFHLDVANGVAPITYQITPIPGLAGLPPGITFNNSTGSFSGTATGTNPYTNMNLQVVDSSNPPRTINTLLLGLQAVPQLQFADQTFGFELNQNYLVPYMTFSGGVPTVYTSLAGGSFPPGVSMETTNNSNFVIWTGSPTAIGDWTAVVRLTDSYHPAEVVTANIHIRVNAAAPKIQTYIPHFVVGVPYSYNMSADYGTRPLNWTISGLPAGLTAGSNGLITGTPTTAGFGSIQASVTDSSIPQKSDLKYINWVAKAPTGRNDSIATATAITNGDYQASLSPYANASNVVQPDQDFYKVVVAPTNTLSVLVFPLNLSLAATKTDPVLEFVDGTGLRLSNCKVPGSTTFTSACLNDDVDPGVNHSSQLYFKNDGASDVTIYLHVLDWAGRARPDLLYGISISGAK